MHGGFGKMFHTLPIAVRAYAESHGFAHDIGKVAQRIEAVTVTVPRQQSVYRFVAHHGDYAQRLAHELSNTDYLHQRGVATPRLQHRETITGYDVLRFGYIAGDVVGIKATDFHAECLGTQLRQIHDRCTDNLPSTCNTIDILFFSRPLFAPNNAHEFTAAQRASAAAEIARFQIHTAQIDGHTLVHTDCHFNNMVFHDDTVTLIDWAECGRGSRFIDIGVVVHDITYHQARTRDNLRAFLRGYFGRTEITNHELVLIDAYVRHRFLEAMIWHLDDTPEMQAAEYTENRDWIATCLHHAQTFTLATWCDVSV